MSKLDTVAGLVFEFGGAVTEGFFSIFAEDVKPQTGLSGGVGAPNKASLD